MQALVDVAFHRPMPLSKCAHAVSICVGFDDVVLIGLYHLPEVHKPLVMVPNFGWHRCHLANAHRPWVIRAYLVQCFMSLLNVAWKMRTNHVRCVNTLANGACRWVTSSGWCMHAYTNITYSMHTSIVNICRPWLMLPSIGRCFLADSCGPCAGLGCCWLPLNYFAFSMRKGHNQCFLAAALRQRLMSPSRCAHDTANACRTCLMLHVISRIYLIDAHIPQQCMHSFYDVAFH